jgi:hypothetical protein
MNRGLKDAEAKVAASAQRMQRARAVMQPTLGALGAGPLGSVLGGIGAAGGGPLALAAGAIAAPILAITKTFESMIEASKGAGEALAKFQATGELAAGMNSVMLERLAKVEARTKGLGEMPGFGAGVAFGTGGEKTLMEEFAVELKKFPTMFGAYLGKLFTAEGTLSEKVGQALASAYGAVGTEGQAQYFEASMRDPRLRSRLHENLTAYMDDPRSAAQVRELRKINRNLS